MGVQLIPLQEKHYSFIKEIYDYYIFNSIATFHTEEITIEELKEVILINHPLYKSYIITFNNNECGYCYFSAFKKRQAYNKTAEITLYLKPECTRKGIGKQVIAKMIEIANELGLRVLIGVITSENISSVSLFEKCGFEKCAHYKQVGEKFNKILDVVAFQKILS